MKSKIFNLETDNWFIVISNFIYDLIKSGVKDIEIKKYIKTRTNQQNRALHLYWSLLAKALNDEGCTYTSKHGIELMFTAFKIESDWREIMLEMYGITTTTELTSEMINKIYDCMNLDYSQNYGVHQEFPNLQSLMNKVDSEKY
jgi:hypothetical protein